MNIGGDNIEITQRMCMAGLKAMAGNCIDQEVPVANGTVTARMCFCDSDLCNSSPLLSNSTEEKSLSKYNLNNFRQLILEYSIRYIVSEL